VRIRVVLDATFDVTRVRALTPAFVVSQSSTYVENVTLPAFGSVQVPVTMFDVCRSSQVCAFAFVGA
jgi:hypothetical protein